MPGISKSQVGRIRLSWEKYLCTKIANTGLSRKHIHKEGQSRNPSLVVSVTKRKRTVSPKYQNRKTYLMAIKDYKRFCSLFYKYMCFLRSANMLSVNNSLTASLPRVLCHWRSGLCPQAGHSCSHQAVPTRQGRSTRGRQPWLAAGSSLGGTAPAAGGPGGSPLLTGGPGTSPSATSTRLQPLPATAPLRPGAPVWMLQSCLDSACINEQEKKSLEAIEA